jgi:hypothetical protein
MSDNFWLGSNARQFPDANGWEYFIVYRKPEGFFWSACDADENLKGPEFGPFGNAKTAYYAGAHFVEQPEEETCE